MVPGTWEQGSNEPEAPDGSGRGEATAYRTTASNRIRITWTRTGRKERCYEPFGCSYPTVGGLPVGVCRQGGADAAHDRSGRAGGDVGSGVSPGESSAAFQAAHARLQAAAAKVNTLLDVAQANLGEAAGTYVAADAAAASTYTGF